MVTWKERAACRGRTDLFFSESPAKVAAAQWICKHCPVFDECAAASVDEQHGVWAGVNKSDRANRQPGALPAGDRRHGKATGYVTFRCRCDECKEWSRRRESARWTNNQDRERTRRRESLRKQKQQQRQQGRTSE